MWATGVVASGMTEAPMHHLCLRDGEIRVILEALEQYEPAGPNASHQRGESEQLARLIQRGTGVRLDLGPGVDRAPVGRPIKEPD